MAPARIPVVGIVGGIGSGKSTIAAELCRRFQGARLDADRAGHTALAQPEVKSRLRQQFGDKIFDAQGQILRSHLAGLVFGSSAGQQSARRELEQIVHPVIRAELLSQLDQHQSQQDCRLIVLDAALLLEAGWDALCDGVVFLDVPPEQRLARVQGRGWSSEDLQRREESQLPLDEKRRRADFIANNAGTPEVTVAQITRWLTNKFQLPESLVS